MKAAPVDLATGELTAERFKILTPKPATPEAMARRRRRARRPLRLERPDRRDVPRRRAPRRDPRAANVDKSWIGTDADALFTKASARDVHVVNDADAAGLAEVRFGAGRDRHGRGDRADVRHRHRVGAVRQRHARAQHRARAPRDRRPRRRARAAASARDREHLAWKDWAKRVERYLRAVVKLFSPDLIIVGGGASRKADKWLPHIDVDAEIVPAALTNEAGIVGAALVGALGRPLT